MAAVVRDEIAAERGAERGPNNYQPSAIPDAYSVDVADRVYQRYLKENPNPALQNLPPPPSVVADELGRTAEEVAQELTARASTLGAAAGFLGDLGAGILSPESLATAVFTPVRVAAVGAAAVTRVAGREAVFGAGFEVPAQVTIQNYKEDLGLPNGFWEGATNVAVVGGLSGVLGGMIRGVVELRNSIRAGRTIPGSAARRLYNDLSPAAQRELEEVSSDALAVEAIVSRQYETNPRFREKLTIAEREGIERAIQLRQNLRPFRPRTQAEADALTRSMDNVGASVAAGLPLRPEDVPADLEALIARANASPQQVRDAMVAGDIRTGAFGAPTQETVEDLRRLFGDTLSEEEVGAITARAEPDPTVSAPPSFRFARGQEKKLNELLEQTGRSRQDVRAAIDAGVVPVGARGQITSKTIEALDTTFDLLPETLRPRETPIPEAPRNVAEMQDRSTALAGYEATTARLGADEVRVMKAQTEEARGEAAEEILRAKAGLPERETTPEADVPPFLRGVNLDDLNYTNGLSEVAEQAGVTAGPGVPRVTVIAQIKAKYPEAFKKKPYDFRGYRDTRTEGIFYHGTPDLIPELQEFTYSTLNYYGQGLYVSDAVDVIHGYAHRSGATRPTAYKVTEKAGVKFYDAEAPLASGVRDLLRRLNSDLVDEAMDEAPANLREVYDKVREISGSRLVSADEVQEVFSVLTEGLEGLGFGGLTHRGGLKTNIPEHTVKIYFNPREQVSLERVDLTEFRVPPPEPQGRPQARPASGQPDPVQVTAREALDEVDTLRRQEESIERCRLG
jgi:hypothetical protein